MRCRLCGGEFRAWMDVGFKVWKCGCGFVGSYVDTERFYKEYGWESEYKDQPQIGVELGLLKVGKLLEVGCNSGTFLEAAKREGFDVYGIDASGDVVEKANRKGLSVRHGSFGPGLGKFDCLVARHVLEHVIDLNGFTLGVRDCVKLGGQVLIEVPDFDFYVEKKDYSCFWEQHVNYFNEDSLRSFFRLSGVRVDKILRFDFSGRSLMMLGTRIPDFQQEYVNSLSNFRDGVLHIIRTKFKNKKIGVYGAGCRSETLIKILGLKPYINYVFDDHPYKIGKTFLGKTVTKPDLRKVDICFLGVNEENEWKVRARHDFKGFVPFFKDFREVMTMPCGKKKKGKK